MKRAPWQCADGVVQKGAGFKTIVLPPVSKDFHLETRAINQLPHCLCSDNVVARV